MYFQTSLAGAADTLDVVFAESVTIPGFFCNPDATGTPFLLVNLREELLEEGSGVASHLSPGLIALQKQAIRTMIVISFILFIVKFNK